MRSSAIAPALLLAAAVPAMAAESRFEKTFPLAPGGEFRLNTSVGRVVVAAGTAPEVRIVVTSKREDVEKLLRFRFDASPRSVTVVAERRRERLFGWFRDSIQFEIQLPAETRLFVDTSGGGIRVAGLRADANVETSGGGIEVRDLVGNLEADTSGGGIRLAKIRGRMRVETSGGGITGEELDGPIDAETSGGSVELTRVTGDVRATSSGGGIRIEEAGGRVEADTSGGSIEARFARGNARGGVLETSGGRIQVALDPTVGLEIDASGNSVRTELPLKVRGSISKRHVQGQLNGGGQRLVMRTSGGGVRIQPL